MKIVATIEIVMREDGHIGVNGPLQDKVACLGMLEMAKQAVLSFDARKALAMPQNRIVLANGEKAA